MKMPKRRITGLFTFRRLRRLRFQSPRSAALPTAPSTKFLQACKPSVCLFGLQKLRKQPERYVQFSGKINMNKKINKILDNVPEI
jgi:hypothetical protein